MYHPQPAIINESGKHGIFVILNVIDPTVSLPLIKQQVSNLLQAANAVNSETSALACHPAFSFGASYWSQLCSEKPAQLKAFSALGQGELFAPATGGDILLHIHANEFDICYQLVKSFLMPLHEHVQVLDEVHGFRYLDSRDLTGFIDGTENPASAEHRASVALISEDATFAGGSYVLAQRFVHQLQQWETLDTPAQEAVIGRTKEDSIELEDDVKPEDAHVSRVVIKENGEELEIVRHSLPYGKASDESGLFFLAYSADLSIFDKMLARMYGTSTDDKHDRLMHFSKAVSGAYFFTPSQEQLAKLL